MITITTKDKKKHHYRGNIIIFQNDYGLVQIMWDSHDVHEEEWYIWNGNGCDLFWKDSIDSIRGEI